MATIIIDIPTLKGLGGTTEIGFTWTGDIDDESLYVVESLQDNPPFESIYLDSVDYTEKIGNLILETIDNQTSYPRSYTIFLRGTENGTPFEVGYNIQQKSNQVISTGEDKYISVIQNNNYSIKQNGVELLSFSPVYTTQFNTSEPIRNFFQKDFLTFSSEEFGVYPCKEFDLYTNNTYTSTYTYFADYSLDPIENQKVISNPIQFDYDNRGYFVQTFRIYNGQYIYYGNDFPQTKSFVRTLPENNVYGDYTYVGKGFQNNIIFGGVSYNVKNLPCKQYELVYKNLKGGWDFLFVRGKVIESITSSRDQYKQNYNNNTYSFGTINWKNTIKTSWKVTTDYLSDEQSDLMPNLLLSNTIYLIDLVNNKIYPVNIVDSQLDVKFFKLDKKPIYYTITLENSQERQNLL